MGDSPLFLRVVEIRQNPHETHTFMGPLDKCGLSGGKIFYCVAPLFIQKKCTQWFMISMTATKWLTFSVKYLSLYYKMNIIEIQAYTTIWIFN